eukprot:Gregarina_sp_Poly_1__2111@NODE_155_length_12405_cov_134_674339_g137_i0_p1_GENE_NODE_155_length_12405_cov_134_674339_g137_i0NODE_155_length_12405_cov_134_674339_g137_i0_p1_ORF_typecomplete_len1336_score215_65PhoLip_ATPase_C/PF16212_5/3_1e37Hydrolase/PF00702_26/0_0044Hydrolase/PF00702_26/7_5e19Hydrolase/PF00702_26/0_015Cation_ATPase/PF13246_6/3_7e15HAD/PF12710_7/0_84HAD/PF12710_7/3_7Hydrolase_3/PF08282_12/11Hydrolase_3/PF08282_12/0_95_NODE_155_length_12405_cov_134_674339_g137_i033597366
MSDVTKNKPSVSTLSILEDLGSITHVFSDKTGTLTQNIMQLKAFDINGDVFGFDDEPSDKDTTTSSGDGDLSPMEDKKAETVPAPSMRPKILLGMTPADPSIVQNVEAEEERWLMQMKRAEKAPTREASIAPERKISSSRSIIPSSLRRNPNRFVDFDASDVRKYLLTRSQNATRRAARDFLLILSVCHTVLPKTSVTVERVCGPESLRQPPAKSPRDDMKQTFYISDFRSSKSSSSGEADSSPSPGGVSPSAGSPIITTPGKLDSIASSIGVSLSPQTKATYVPRSSVGSSGNGDRDVEQGIEEPQSLHRFSVPISSESVSSRPLSPIITRDSSPSIKSSNREPGIKGSPKSRHSTLQSPSTLLSPLNEEELFNQTAVKEEVARHSQAPPDDTLPMVFARLFTAELPVGPQKRLRVRDARKHPREEIQHSSLPKKFAPPDALHRSAAPSLPLYRVPESDDLVPGVQIAAVKWNGSLSAQFDASSPDELALVAGAKHLGLEFLRRPDLNSIEVGILNTNAERLFMEESDRIWIEQRRQQVGRNIAIIPSYTYEILDCLDFDNIRKRMSVIMRDRDGTIKLLTKGADSSMLSVAAPGQQKYLKSLEDSLADFAREGLRTLVLGLKVLSEAEFSAWKAKVDKLRGAGVDDCERYCECFSEIETNLVLVGCTAIDDKLQDQVPQTIEALKDAGIRVWVLTGDKVETAISIGHSANLLTDSTYNAIIDGATPEEVRDQMYKYMAFVVGGQLAKEAFDQILLQETPSSQTEVNSPNGDADDQEAKTICCRPMRVCCVRGESGGQDRKRRRLGNQKRTVAMDLDDFVNVLTFNAKHKKIVAPVDGKSAPKALRAEELEQLIAVYVEKFEPVADKKKGWDLGKRIGGMVGVGKKEDLSVPKASPRATPVEAPTPESVEQYTSVALTVTGDALNHALSTDETRKYFFGLAHLCSTVIACRVTPKQKAEVVRQCGRCTPTQSFTSLGIGDGANDVGMILTANVGVGIHGKEGSQAARSADIAIGEFKIVRNLLFFHGHQILRRHAIMLYQTIFKNIMFSMACYLCGFFSGFSAADPYNAYLKQLYNLLFTPWCIMAIAVFDRALPYDVLFKCSSLYPIAMRPDGTHYFGARWFTSWFLFGIFAGVIVTLFPFAVISLGVAEHTSGLGAFDWDSYGNSVFILVVIIACAVSIPFTHTVFWFTPLAFILSWGALLASWLVVSYMKGSSLEGSFIILNSTALYHLTMLVAASTPLLFLFAWWKYKNIFHPTPPVIIRERIKKGVFDVVVAPRKRGELAVVVPKAQQRESWKGFAFSPSETRYSLRRKTLSMQKMNGVLEEAGSYSVG